MTKDAGLRLVRASTLVAAPSRGFSPCAFPLGLCAEGLHELAEASYGEVPACLGAALAARSHHLKNAPHGSDGISGRMIVIVETRGRVHQNGGLSHGGIGRFGLDPACVIRVWTRSDGEALWAGEEALRSGAAGLVLIRPGGVDFTATRRLGLVCRQTGVPGVLLMPPEHYGASAASGRWRVASRPSAVTRNDPKAPGNSRWRVCLDRSRERPEMSGMQSDVEWDHETLSLRVVSGLGDRSLVPARSTGENITGASGYRGRGVRRTA
jgi:protein ImuA